MATPLETFKTQYQNSQERQNSLKWQNATINDVAKKYGFNFSKDYANQQAEAVAAAQRNQYNSAARQNQSTNMQTMKELDTNLKDGIVGTENTFFQNYLQQRQNQANRGLNAGVQADQDLRLGMNQQSVLAGLYRDTNNARSKEMDRFNNQALDITEALALVEKQKLTEAEKLYQEMITKGYGILGTERGWYNTLDQQAYGRYQDDINLWYKEQDRLAQEAARAEAARRARAQAAAQQQAAQQSALQKQLQAYQNQLAQQAAPKLTPIQQYYSTPARQAVNNVLSNPTTSYATRYAFTNPLSNTASTVKNNSNLSYYDKMKMIYGE
jgi:hypothetical protein